jgi:hypothetical protein
MLEDYLGVAWQFLNTVESYLGESYMSYDIVDGLSLLQLRNSTYLNNH